MQKPIFRVFVKYNIRNKGTASKEWCYRYICINRQYKNNRER